MSTQSHGTTYLRPEARQRHLEPLLALERVCFYADPEDAMPRAVLDDVSMVVGRGELIAITGAPGSGMSAVLHVVGGFARPTSGRIILDGKDLGPMSDEARARLRSAAIGYVHSVPFLLDDLSILENVMLPMQLARAKARVARERARMLLERVDLAAVGDKRPGELAIDQRQRAALARSLANDPIVLLADEPASRLHTAEADDFHGLLRSLNDDGLTIVYATTVERLSAFAPRRITLLDGRIAREQEDADPGSPSL